MRHVYPPEDRDRQKLPLRRAAPFRSPRATLSLLAPPTPPYPLFFFFFNDPATTEISPLPLPDPLRISHVEALVRLSEAAGVCVNEPADAIPVRRRNGRLTGTDVMPEPFPGFATDLQAQIMALMATA